MLLIDLVVNNISATLLFVMCICLFILFWRYRKTTQLVINKLRNDNNEYRRQLEHGTIVKLEHCKMADDASSALTEANVKFVKKNSGDQLNEIISRDEENTDDESIDLDLSDSDDSGSNESCADDDADAEDAAECYRHRSDDADAEDDAEDDAEMENGNHFGQMMSNFMKEMIDNSQQKPTSSVKIEIIDPEIKSVNDKGIIIHDSIEEEKFTDLEIKDNNVAPQPESGLKKITLKLNNK
jgi:hypothetical protein